VPTLSRSSNDNGRSLEYLIAKSLGDTPGVRLTSRAQTSQIRDENNLDNIDPRLRITLKKAGSIAAGWVISELRPGSKSFLEVDRSSDGDEGVADLIISTSSLTLPLSVKLNHDALSHPRPYSLTAAVGLSGTAIDIDHRSRMDKAGGTFRRRIGRVETFSLVPHEKAQLYFEICEVCVETLNVIRKKPKNVAALFNFLVGPGCKKVVVRTNATKDLSEIEVFDYQQIEIPRTVQARTERRTEASSIVMNFDNGWQIGLRIHNASSRISPANQLSLKFDAQRISGKIPPSEVLFDGTVSSKRV